MWSAFLLYLMPTQESQFDNPTMDLKRTGELIFGG
jgi:hypothetical protein